MIELVFVVCLQSEPQICEERAMMFVDVTPMACMMGAQPQLAKWANEHPKWKVSGWKCGAIDRRSANL